MCYESCGTVLWKISATVVDYYKFRRVGASDFHVLVGLISDPIFPCLSDRLLVIAGVYHSCSSLYEFSVNGMVYIYYY